MRRTRLVFLCLGVSLIMPAFPGHGEEPPHSLELSISSEQTSYELAKTDSIPVTLHIKNVGTEPVKPFYLLQRATLLCNGEEEPLSKWLVWRGNIEGVLEPGADFSYSSVNVKLACRIKGPGSYSLAWKIDDMQSNRITIRVTRLADSAVHEEGFQGRQEWAIAQCLAQIRDGLLQLRGRYPQLSDIGDAKMTGQTLEYHRGSATCPEGKFTWVPIYSEKNYVVMTLSLQHAAQKDQEGEYGQVDRGRYFPEAQLRVHWTFGTNPAGDHAEEFRKAIDTLVWDHIDALVKELSSTQ